MITPELKAYIAQERALGIAETEIYTALKAVGWQEGDIQEALKPLVGPAPVVPAKPVAPVTSPASSPVVSPQAQTSGNTTQPKQVASPAMQMPQTQVANSTQARFGGASASQFNASAFRTTLQEAVKQPTAFQTPFAKVQPAGPSTEPTIGPRIVNKDVLKANEASQAALPQHPPKNPLWMYIVIVVCILVTAGVFAWNKYQSMQPIDLSEFEQPILNVPLPTTTPRRSPTLLASTTPTVTITDSGIKATTSPNVPLAENVYELFKGLPDLTADEERVVREITQESTTVTPAQVALVSKYGAYINAVVGQKGRARFYCDVALTGCSYSKVGNAVRLAVIQSIDLQAKKNYKGAIAGPRNLIELGEKVLADADHPTSTFVGLSILDFAYARVASVNPLLAVSDRIIPTEAENTARTVRIQKALDNSLNAYYLDTKEFIKVVGQSTSTIPARLKNRSEEITTLRTGLKAGEWDTAATTRLYFDSIQIEKKNVVASCTATSTASKGDSEFSADKKTLPNYKGRLHYATEYLGFGALMTSKCSVLGRTATLK
jgi:hypothetical protein